MKNIAKNWHFVSQEKKANEKNKRKGKNCEPVFKFVICYKKSAEKRFSVRLVREKNLLWR